MMDVFDKYKTILARMSMKIDSTDFPEFNVLRGRLMENIDQVRLFGDTPTRQSDRAMILDSLNRMAVGLLNRTLDELYEPTDSLKQMFENGIDIVVYVALSEEFTYVIEELGMDFKPFELPDIAISVYYGNLKEFGSNEKYNVIVIPAGKMGNTRSGNIMSAILTKYNSKNIAVLGIAGSITDELQPGDVFIPDSVFEYLANSETSGIKKLSFIPSGNQLPTAPRLLNRFQLFQTNNQNIFRQWRMLIKDQINSIVGQETLSALNTIGLKLPLECKLLVGDDRKLGSGPAVGKGQAFVKWIKGTDRKVVALEMESAGVYDAAFIRTPAPQTVAIRGISDFADERKKKLEVVGKDRLRILAIKNATSLLILSIRAGLFKWDANR